MNAQHTPGRLAAVQLTAPHGTLMIESDQENTGLIAVMEHGKKRIPDHDQAKANRSRMIACWNACEGLDTDEIEKWGLGAATGGAIYRLTQQREELLKVVKGFRAWADNQADAQSKGCHATFDLWMLREQCDLASAAIAKVEGGAP